MAEQLPLRKYVKVWIMRRKNNPRKGGKPPTVSYTLQWTRFGKKGVMSLGRGATLAFARRMAAEKEKELNDPDHRGYLEPCTWAHFRQKYLDLTYPGHELGGKERQQAAGKWAKSLSTMLRERAAMDAFERSVLGREDGGAGAVQAADPFCHDFPVTCREAFINGRLAAGGAPATAESDLGALRYLFGLMEEWRHRPRGSNPFAGKGKSSVGARRKHQDDEGAADEKDTGYYTLAQLRALLARADREVADDPGSWTKKRLRTLVYFEAYTGCRIREALFLDWEKGIDLERGIAWLRHKPGNRLKTAGSAAPIGLPDALVRVLREWQREQTCGWVFPNQSGRPWVTAGPGYKPLDQLKALATRAGIGHATWKMFRHSFDTHGKGRFGMSSEQMRAQLRHTSTDTQKHYDHADLDNLREAVRRVDLAGEGPGEP